MTKIALYGQKLLKKDLPYITYFIKYTEERNMEVYIEKKFFKKIKSYKRFKYLENPIFSFNTKINKDFEYIFTFGGDGTILSCITFNLGIPIVGINTGNLGFLSTFNKIEFLKKLDHILEHKFQPIARSLLWVETNDSTFSKKQFALNEISVLRKENTSMITIDAYIEGEFLTSYWGDGLIISTPTGSTGYSLSCGGPIISPENKNFVLTPIAPHNLFSRPLIIPYDQKIRLKVHSRAYVYSICLDARINFLHKNTELLIKKAPFNVYIIAEKNYYNTIREKLLWGADKRNYRY